jgi:GST-like protein
MAGERFTLADIAAVTIAQSMFQTVAWEQSAKLRLWYERVMRLPSVLRGLHAFDG